ncbi:MAG TPA: DUF202 domain-containing protein [Bryobacteraceae bacterium]|nr:DUF202 domain-containing protein [Bryobacteraceae bacterium]
MSSTGSLADYLAAERTFLAWIRTGLALMGLGFVVARFGLFLQTLALAQARMPLQETGWSFWFGTALIVLGVAVQVLCTLAHVRLVRRLASGAPASGEASTLAIGVAAVLAIIGLALAVYLISVRDPAPRRAANIREDADGNGRPSYNASANCAARHGLPLAAE